LWKLRIYQFTREKRDKFKKEKLDQKRRRRKIFKLDCFEISKEAQMSRIKA
jgi:hypothetical protein